LALTVLAMLAGGCQRDVEKADTAVDQHIADADFALAYHPGKPDEAIAQANKAITAARAAVSESGASDLAKARAQSGAAKRLP
jgi:nickel-dependent lactate racemase